MEIDEYITRCVVKIFAKSRYIPRLFRCEQKIAGTGFWILPDGYIVTCHHVVVHKGQVPKSIEIEYRGQRLKGAYCPERSHPDADLAILQVKEEHLQPDYVLLGRAKADAEVRAYGYRYGFSEGYRMTGVLRPGQCFPHDMGEIYNFENKLPEEGSLVGMSGGPVYDPKQGLVIGVQYAEEESGPSIGYIHPIDKICKKWPELESRNSNTLLAKLRDLENQTNHGLTEFSDRQLDLPYPERNADRRLREKLAEATAESVGLWIVRGEAGIGKSTLLLRLVQWCQARRHQFPVLLDQSYFYDDEKYGQFWGVSPKETRDRLQDYARLKLTPLVLFIDALDVILPHTDATKLVAQLKELSYNAIVICTSRPFELQRLIDDDISPEEIIDLDRLSDEHVRLILQGASRSYQIQAHKLDPGLLEMCQNPFVLNLVLQSSRTEALPEMRNVTDTWIKERYWVYRIERVRQETYTAFRFGGMTKSEVGKAKAKVAHDIADRMFTVQTYRLDAEVIMELLRGLNLDEIASQEITNQEKIKQAIFNELIDEDVIYSSGWISFLHDTYADFIICRRILASDEWRDKVDRLLEHIDVRFYVPILVHLVLQARDTEQFEVENRIYDTMVTILARKLDGQKELNRAWGVTYALRELAPVWIDRLCKGLHGSYTQEVASSVASVLEDLRRPLVRDALIAGMNHYKYKRRFVDNLGASGDPLVVGPLLGQLERLLNTRDDDELLETLAIALGKIGDDRAAPLLTRLEADEAMPRAARRAARAALYLITLLAKYSEPLPYNDEETIKGLKIKDARDTTRYSDWKKVKQTADKIAEEVQNGKPVSTDVVDSLHSALDHEHEDAQLAVVGALSTIASEVSVDRLIVKVMDHKATPDTVRKKAVRALRAIVSQKNTTSGCRKNVLSTFRRIASEDPNPEIRRMALEATNNSKTGSWRFRP